MSRSRLRVLLPRLRVLALLPLALPLLLPASLRADCGLQPGTVKLYESETKETSLPGISGYKPDDEKEKDDYDPSGSWNTGPVWKWRKRALAGYTQILCYTQGNCSEGTREDYSGEYDPVAGTYGARQYRDGDCSMEFVSDPDTADGLFFVRSPQSRECSTDGIIRFSISRTLTQLSMAGCGSMPPPDQSFESCTHSATATETLLEPVSVDEAWENAVSEKGIFGRAFEKKILTNPESVVEIPLARRTVTVTLNGCGGPYKIIAPYQLGDYGGHTGTTEAWHATPANLQEGEETGQGYRPFLVPGLESITFDDNGEHTFKLPLFPGKITKLLEDRILLIPEGCQAGQFGQPTLRQASAHFLVHLGSAPGGGAAGVLTLHETSLTPATFTPGRLAFYPLTPEARSLHDPSGDLRQVLVPDGLADIVTFSPTAYAIHLYPAAQVGAADPLTGLHPATGQPLVTYAIQEAPGSTPGNLMLSIAETRAAKTIETTFQQSGDNWQTSYGNGLRMETLSVSSSGGDRIETREIRNADTTLVERTVTTIHPYPFGEKTIEETLGSGPAARTTVYTYYDNPATDAAAYGKLKREVTPAGSWTDWHYDAEGRRAKRVTQFLNTAPGTADNLNRVTTWTYSTVPDLDADTLDEALETQTDTLLGQETARRHRLALSATGGAGETAWRETRDIVTTAPGAAWDAPANLVTITRKGVAGPLKDRELHRQAPDGLLTTLELTPLPGNARRWTSRTGIPHAGGILGRREETTEDALGRETLREVYQSGLLAESAQVIARDSLGRPTETLFLDGTTELRTYACCGLAQFRSRDGILTTYERDDLGRVERETTSGITLQHTHDAANRITKTLRLGSDQSAITLSEATYDTAGRLLSEIDAMGRVTTHTEQLLNNGQLERRTQHPDGGEEIRLYHPDGSPASVRGDAATWRDYAYGVDTDGCYEQELFPRGDEGSSPPAQWTKRYTDHAGRPGLVRHADNAQELVTYDASGRPASRTDADAVRTLYAHGRQADSEGRLEEWSTTALDLNANHQIDPAGPDRIQRTTTSHALRGTTPVRRTVTEVWENAGSATPTEVSVTETSLDGLKVWQTTRGQLTATLTTLDANTATRTQTTTHPTGLTETRVYQTNRLASVTVAHASLGTLSTVTYEHDAHGRLWKVHASTGTTTYAYFDDDQIASVTTPDPGSGAQTTAYAYNSRGRVSKVTAPDGAETHTTYWPNGQVKRT